MYSIYARRMYCTVYIYTKWKFFECIYIITCMLFRFVSQRHRQEPKQRKKRKKKTNHPTMVCDNIFAVRRRYSIHFITSTPHLCCRCGCVSVAATLPLPINNRNPKPISSANRKLWNRQGEPLVCVHVDITRKRTSIGNQRAGFPFMGTVKWFFHAAQQVFGHLPQNVLRQRRLSYRATYSCIEASGSFNTIAKTKTVSHAHTYLTLCMYTIRHSQWAHGTRLNESEWKER